jgi:hypothetical protein
MAVLVLLDGCALGEVLASAAALLDWLAPALSEACALSLAGPAAWALSDAPALAPADCAMVGAAMAAAPSIRMDMQIVFTLFIGVSHEVPDLPLRELERLSMQMSPVPVSRRPIAAPLCQADGKAAPGARQAITLCHSGQDPRALLKIRVLCDWNLRLSSCAASGNI